MVEDERAFNSSVDARFAALDADRDGRLSYAEMAGELMALRVREAHFGADSPACTGRSSRASTATGTVPWTATSSAPR